MMVPPPCGPWSIISPVSLSMMRVIRGVPFCACVLVPRIPYFGAVPVTARPASLTRFLISPQPVRRNGDVPVPGDVGGQGFLRPPLRLDVVVECRYPELDERAGPQHRAQLETQPGQVVPVAVRDCPPAAGEPRLHPCPAPAWHAPHRVAFLKVGELRVVGARSAEHGDVVHERVQLTHRRLAGVGGGLAALGILANRGLPSPTDYAHPTLRHNRPP